MCNSDKKYFDLFIFYQGGVIFLKIAAKLGTSATPAAPAGNGAGFNANPNPLTGGLADKGNPNSMPLGMKRGYPGGAEDDVSAKKPTTEPDGELSLAVFRCFVVHLLFRLNLFKKL